MQIFYDFSAFFVIQRKFLPCAGVLQNLLSELSRQRFSEIFSRAPDTVTRVIPDVADDSNDRHWQPLSEAFDVAIWVVFGSF